ncbi:MAG TPA: hypothetical protein VD969_06770 [Symbiobacteriaceae bacterium]|nr:hypothetical protein [Symbiobacteriaceae bacterium]
MSSDRELTREEEERQHRAAVHRWLGVAALVLTVVAVVVAVWRLNVSLAEHGAELGITLGDSMRDMLGALVWVLVLVAIGVLLSLGTTRIMPGVEKLVRLVRGKKSGSR